MKKHMFIAVSAKKKFPLSFYIYSTSYKLFFTNLRINCNDRTPPPLKSVYGYCP